MTETDAFTKTIAAADGGLPVSLDPGVRTCAAHRFAKRSLPHRPADAGRPHGFGIGHFGFDESHGYARTATEASSDNSALMRSIRRHENALQEPIIAISRAVMCVSRGFGESIPDEGTMRVMFDDSIIQDVSAEKAQDMA